VGIARPTPGLHQVTHLGMRVNQLLLAQPPPVRGAAGALSDDEFTAESGGRLLDLWSISAAFLCSCQGSSLALIEDSPSPRGAWRFFLPILWSKRVLNRKRIFWRDGVSRCLF